MLYPENQMTRQLFFDTKCIKCQIKCPHKIAAKAGIHKCEIPKHLPGFIEKLPAFYETTRIAYKKQKASSNIYTLLDKMTKPSKEKNPPNTQRRLF